MLYYVLLGFMLANTLAVKFWLLHGGFALEPATFVTIVSLLQGSWTLKFVWAAAYDRYRASLDYRWCLAVLMGVHSLCWVAMSMCSSLEVGLVALSLNSWTMCVGDVICDGLMVRRAHREDEEAKGTVQSNVWFCRMLGAVLGGVGQLLLLKEFGAPAYFGYLSLFPATFVVVLGVELRVSAKRAPREQGPRMEIDRGWSLMVDRLRPALWTMRHPLIFIVILSLVPTAGEGLFLFETAPVLDASNGGLGFDERLVSGFDLMFAFACMVSALAYKRWLRHVAIRTVFVWTIVIGVGVSLLNLVLIEHLYTGWRASVFALVDSFVSGFIAELCFLPTTVLIARSIPPGLESTLYAMCTSFQNLAGIVAGLASAGLLQAYGIRRSENGTFDFQRLWMLSLTCSALGLVPLCVVRNVEVAVQHTDADTEESIPLTPLPVLV